MPRISFRVAPGVYVSERLGGFNLQSCLMGLAITFPVFWCLAALFLSVMMRGLSRQDAGIVWILIIGSGLIYVFLLVAGWGLWRAEKKTAQEKQRRLAEMDSLSADELAGKVAGIFGNYGASITTEIDKGDRRIMRVKYPDGDHWVVMVKRTFDKVGVPDIRALYALVSNASSSQGVFFTNETYTPQAYKWAEGKPLQLVDENGLDTWAEKVGVNWK